MTKQERRIARRMRWLIFNLRWLLLAAAAFLVFVNAGPSGPDAVVIALVVVTLLYNIGLTLLEFFESWEAWQPWLLWGMFAADSLLALGLFRASGDNSGPLIWIGLLPAVTVALQTGWPSALGAIAVFHLTQAGLLLLLYPESYSGLLPLLFGKLALLDEPLNLLHGAHGLHLALVLVGGGDADILPALLVLDGIDVDAEFLVLPDPHL